MGLLTLASWATPAAAPVSVNSGQHFLPPYGNTRDRFAFDTNESVALYDVAQLGAGWYTDWGSNLDPLHPDQLAYAQLIRLHAGSNPHDPGQVTIHPDWNNIPGIVAAHPGALWMVGNEPDSVYQGDPILPEVYAVAYHDLYYYIKGLDPTALIANGGIVQPTPCRIEYLDIVRDTYQSTYGEPMPVDVWNIHAFVLREVYESWGASTPPGVDPSCGLDYTIEQADDLGIFWDNIQALRGWMKENGYQDRPLIISEYGILWPEWFAPQFTPARVSRFMTGTFDLFLYETDPDIGFPADDGRLVQTWAWYTLSDKQPYNGSLFYSANKQLTPMGAAYAAYTGALSDTPSADLSARLLAAWPDFAAADYYSGTIVPLTFTVSLTGEVANLGKLTATDALVRMEVISGEDGTAIFGQDTYYTLPGRFEGVVALPPISVTLATQGRHELRLSLDPEDVIPEPREWNNVVTTTLDLRPDLAPLDLTYRLSRSVLQSGTLLLTTTVVNQGDWPSPVSSGTIALEVIPEGALSVPQTISIPPLEVSEQIQVGVTIPWPEPDHELYQVNLQLDPAGLISEQNDANNRYELVIPVVLSATLTPEATTVLTSASDSLVWVFPPGVVAEPTQILFTPLWPDGWEVQPLQIATSAFSLTAKLDGEPTPLTFLRPVSVTWRYRPEEVEGLDEARLRLFWHAGTGSAPGGWWDAGDRPYQRDPGQNRLEAFIRLTGRFVYGTRFDRFMPIVGKDGPPDRLGREPGGPAPEPEWPPSPLRLPVPGDG
jgi:hypothetical protein